jgi:hypothetical protein
MIGTTVIKAAARFADLLLAQSSARREPSASRRH